MRSYREVHTGPGVGEQYDAMHAIRVDSLIWEEFVRPYVRGILQREADAGAKRYLDFACGTGRLLKVGASLFADSTGIDVSDDMLEVARKRAPGAKILHVDVTQDPHAVEGTFDCVTLFRFLLNAEPDLRTDVLNWLASKMKPGALLVVNNHRSSRSIGGVLARFAKPDGRRELNTLSRELTEELLASTGFIVESCSGFRVLPSIHGRPLIHRWLQLQGERLCKAAGLGRAGSELVFTARRR